MMFCKVETLFLQDKSDLCQACYTSKLGGQTRSIRHLYELVAIIYTTSQLKISVI